MSLNQLSALEVAARVRAGELSAREVLEASLSQIRAVDGQPGRLDNNHLTPLKSKKYTPLSA